MSHQHGGCFLKSDLAEEMKSQGQEEEKQGKGNRERTGAQKSPVEKSEGAISAVSRVREVEETSHERHMLKRHARGPLATSLKMSALGRTWW